MRLAARLAPHQQAPPPPPATRFAVRRNKVLWCGGLCGALRCAALCGRLRRSACPAVPGCARLCPAVPTSAQSDRRRHGQSLDRHFRLSFSSLLLALSPQLSASRSCIHPIQGSSPAPQPSLKCTGYTRLELELELELDSAIRSAGQGGAGRGVGGWSGVRRGRCPWRRRRQYLVGSPCDLCHRQRVVEASMNIAITVPVPLS